MHALLTPGTHVLRRSADVVQVGLGPGRTVRLPPGQAADAADPVVLGRLRAAGLAADDDRSLRQALPAHRDGAPWPRHSVAALFRTDPDAMAARVAARRLHEVTVTAGGHPLAERLADDLVELCRRSALRLVSDRAPGPPRKGASVGRPVAAVVCVGEPRRELVDPLVRDGVPHLLVRLVEGRAVVGPFVEPGATPCLRCLDAHLAAEDPAWPLLVEQYARASARDRPDGVPEPVDAALAALAVAWAARDLATFVDGGRPVSLATTVRLSPALESLETRAWLPHPGCGCGWA